MLRHLFPGAIEPSQDSYDTGPLRRPLPRHPATRRTRWLWLVPLVAGFLAVLGYVISHDPGPGLSLSGRGWFTIGLAALLVLMLGMRRHDGQLMRAAMEYVVVFALAALMATTAGAPQQAQAAPGAQAQAQAQAAGACPSVLQARAWLTCLWHQASAATKADQQASPTTTTRPHRR
jgi:hypothetical protein